jgi:hypothetical protein
MDSPRTVTEHDLGIADLVGTERVACSLDGGHVAIQHGDVASGELSGDGYA